MDRHFLLPVCFAAAAHGALLFGFTRDPRPLKPGEPKICVTEFKVHTVEDEPEVIVDQEREPAAPRKLPDVSPPPRLPERVVLDPGVRLAMKPPPIRPVGDSDMRAIPDSDWGVAREVSSAAFPDVLSSVRLDSAPRTRFQAAPVYPFAAKREGLAGEVHVEFIVDERGRVVAPRVRHSTNRIFEEATLRAVAKWQFEPGRHHGSIVRFRMTVPVLFTLHAGL